MHGSYAEAPASLNRPLAAESVGAGLPLALRELPIAFQHQQTIGESAQPIRQEIEARGANQGVLAQGATACFCPDRHIYGVLAEANVTVTSSLRADTYSLRFAVGKTRPVITFRSCVISAQTIRYPPLTPM
jgi:hypothetical protein